MSEPKTPRKYAHNRREYAPTAAPQVSEPKTPDEFLRELNRAFQALYPSVDALDNAVGAIAARDEQIREQERVRVREVLRGENKESCNAGTVARNRRLVEAGSVAAIELVTVKRIAAKLGIDLERPEPAEHAKAERKCVRCGERYFDGETRCEDECAAGAGSIGCCGGDVVPVDAATEGTDG